MFAGRSGHAFEYCGDARRRIDPRSCKPDGASDWAVGWGEGDVLSPVESASEGPECVGDDALESDGVCAALRGKNQEDFFDLCAPRLGEAAPATGLDEAALL